MNVGQVEDVLASLVFAYGGGEGAKLLFGAAKTASGAAVEIQLQVPDDGYLTWQEVGKGSTVLDALRDAVERRQQLCLKQAIDVERERARASGDLRAAEELVRQVRDVDAGGAA